MPAARRSTAQLRVEPRGLPREVVALGEAGRGDDATAAG
jgi:hypothetical protein